MLNFTDEYRQRLNLALNDPKRIGVDVSGPAPAQIQGQAPRQMPQPELMEEAPPQQAPATNLAAAVSGAGPELPEGPAIATPGFNPNAPHPMEQVAAGGRMKIESRPPDLDLSDVDPEKLQGVKTVKDAIDLLPEDKLNHWMDWSEKQRGKINEQYDKMRDAVPGLPEKLSRKEKFGLLMEFGLQLMRNSASDRYGGDIASAFGTSAHDTARGFQNLRAGQAAGRQRTLDDIERRRQADLKSMPDPLEMARTSAEIDERDARAVNLRAGNAKEDILDTEGGLYRIRGDELEQLTDPVSGKPLRGRGGSRLIGGGRDSRTAQEKNVEFMTQNGIPREKAMEIVFKLGNDPSKAAAALYNVMKRQYSDDAEAREATSAMIDFIYGPGAIQRSQEPAIRPKPSQNLGAFPRVDDNDPLGIRR